MRLYTIELSCGCLISLDNGGGRIPCDYNRNNPDCKYEEEFLCNPKWVEWEVLGILNNINAVMPDEDIASLTADIQTIYDYRMKRLKKEN